MEANVERIAKHIEALSKFTSTPGEGVTRLSYSKEDLGARAYIKEQMETYGLLVYEDGMGNVFGKLPGRGTDLPSVIIGSHFDSVPNGGAYDGAAGVVAGLEVAALFQEHAITPEHPLEVIAMVEEEGTRFGSGLMGSRGIVGNLTEEYLNKTTDNDGISIREAMTHAGVNTEVPRKRDPKTIKAFLEMHIEQGPVLEEAKVPIGIVEGIVGLAQLEVTIEGKAGHAGTTPMEKRKDAMVTAGKMVGQLPELAIDEGYGTVITTGKLQVYPNGANVIPNKVVFTVDIRAGEEQQVLNVIDKTKTLIQAHSVNGMKIHVEEQLYIQPKALDLSIKHLLEETSKTHNITYLNMNSGAGHDAMVLSDVTPTGLLFIPSLNGLSHCPEEYSEPADIAKSVDILYTAIKELVLGK
ncbi:Allantoate deiminase [Lentibacillus sp. JNUCC-1]|uniref:Zn-dependent hydrolase n=1 Tax=Lentibacillus sp. JNUCC-1 TaxID=2654513 RepID=UPI0013267F20|nr:Allantoate deiminase [Lentibacillus sp. JNUCC-1]